MPGPLRVHDHRQTQRAQPQHEYRAAPEQQRRHQPRPRRAGGAERLAGLITHHRPADQRVVRVQVREVRVVARRHRDQHVRQRRVEPPAVRADPLPLIARSGGAGLRVLQCLVHRLQQRLLLDRIGCRACVADRDALDDPPLGIARQFERVGEHANRVVVTSGVAPFTRGHRGRRQRLPVPHLAVHDPAVGIGSKRQQARRPVPAGAPGPVRGHGGEAAGISPEPRPGVAARRQRDGDGDGDLRRPQRPASPDHPERRADEHRQQHRGPVDGCRQEAADHWRGTDDLVVEVGEGRDPQPDEQAEDDRTCRHPRSVPVAATPL